MQTYLIKIIVVCVLSRTVTVFSYPSELTKKYGERCDGSDYCTGELISCQNGVCGCVTAEYMTYDPNENRCLVQAGKNCDAQGQISNCIRGAFCNEGFCVCKDGFYSSPNGTCLPKKNFKDSCNSDYECDTTNSKTLVCVEGTCQCEKRGQIFNTERKQCVSNVDSECDSENSIYVNQCVTNGECVAGHCKCQNGYAKSSQGKCELGYGQQCGGSLNLCADIYFSCIEGICQCKHPLHQTYDERTEECLSIVSGPCTFPKISFTDITLTGVYDIQKCTKNSHCVDRGFYSECECKPGFVQTQKGTCAPGFGQSCESEECENITPLFCRNNKCDCMDMLQVYDVNIKRCVGLIGSRCTTAEPDCVEFASCVLTDSAVNVGKCLCDKYASEIANRTCDYRV